MTGTLTALGKKLLQSVAGVDGMLQYHLPDGCRMTGMDAVIHNAGGATDTAFIVRVFNGGKRL